MQTLKLYRNPLQDGVATYGIFLTPKGKQYNTIELPWRGNLSSLSCIPADFYLCKQGVNSKGKPVINVLNVPGRTEIQIHVENYANRLLGCIAPGMSRKDMNQDGKLDTGSSWIALDKIMDEMPDEFILEIIGEQKI